MSEADWHAVIARMTPLLREARPFHALQDGLAALEALLRRKGFSRGGAGTNELPDRPDRGARRMRRHAAVRALALVAAARRLVAAVVRRWPSTSRT